MQNTYGVLDNEGTHIDVSNTEKGAKQYANRNGYNEVTVRFRGGYVAKVVAEKIDNKWVTV